MRRGPRLFLAFYGDDLTGSTDALESAILAGMRTVLFLEPPAPRELADYPGLRAVGVAGMTRALPPAAMRRTLKPAFEALRALGPRHVHYKICSTFDSSPTLGSIGAAIATGASVFGGAFVPVIGGAPALGRYCAFGNLFARTGIGTDGKIYRLDRHPTMSVHPATPAHESDLRVVLARQGVRRIALVDFLVLSRSRGRALAAVDAALKERPDAVLFDALTEEHVRRVGEILEARAGRGRPLFSVGPSSIEAALGRMGGAGPSSVRKAGPAGGPLLAASGSGSPVTRRQIAWAVRRGFREVVLGPRAAATAAAHLRAGSNVVLHAGASNPGPRFGWDLGKSVWDILGSVRAARIVLAGGDSSSRAGRALGIRSLEMIARLTPGGPLCRARAPGSPADGCEVVLKGGQVGGDDYFGVAAAGLRGV